MQNPSDDIHSEEFLHQLMRRQLRLSISIAFTFGILLLGLPLANYFAPELMGKNVGGFTLTWLILGVLFFPFVWLLSWIFIKASMGLENEISKVKSPASESETRTPKS